MTGPPAGAASADGLHSAPWWSPPARAAETLAILNPAQAGDRLVSSASLYGGTYNLIHYTLPKLGIEVSFVEDPDDPAAWQAAARPTTKAFFAESIGNPKYDVLDIEAVAKLARRFDANTYVVLMEAMSSHDLGLGRGRGRVAAALRAVRGQVVVAGIDSDRLYPLYQQEGIAAGVAGAGPVRLVRSAYGHDGFLLEADQVGALVEEVLARSMCTGRSALPARCGR